MKPKFLGGLFGIAVATAFIFLLVTMNSSPSLAYPLSAGSDWGAIGAYPMPDVNDSYPLPDDPSSIAPTTNELEIAPSKTSLIAEAGEFEKASFEPPQAIAGQFQASGQPPPTIGNIIATGDNSPVFLPLLTNDYPVRLTYGEKGFGDAWQNWRPPEQGSNLDALDYSWYYDWTFSYLPERNDDTKYVRMLWCQGLSPSDVNGNTVILADKARQDFINGIQGRVWLVLNEPDDGGQCGANTIPTYGGTFEDNPQGAARFFSDVYDVIKENDPHAIVFTGGLLWLSSPQTRAWWDIFVQTLVNDGELYKIEGVHIHLYPEFSNSSDRDFATSECSTTDCVKDLAIVANDWYDQMHVQKGLGDRPIWLTEVGWLLCGSTNSAWVNNNFVVPMTEWYSNNPNWDYPSVPTNPGFDAIAWYATYTLAYDQQQCTFLLDSLGPDGETTIVGESWNIFNP